MQDNLQRHLPIEQRAPHFNPQDVETLRAETRALRQELEHLGEQYTARELEFEEVCQAYEAKLQPRAYGLARAMLQYVPDSDPRISKQMHVGNLGIRNSIDLGEIAAPLMEHLASTQLRGVADILNSLSTYLPET